MPARKRLPELLCGPFRRRVGGHVVMEDSAGAQIHDDEHIQRSERGGDHHEEVACCDHLGMVADENQPALLGIGRANGSTCVQVLAYRARRYRSMSAQEEPSSLASLSRLSAFYLSFGAVLGCAPGAALLRQTLPAAATGAYNRR